MIFFAINYKYFINFAHYKNYVLKKQIENIPTSCDLSEYKIPQFAVDNPPEGISELEDALKGGFWSFIGLAVIAGFLALLTQIGRASCRERV